MSTFKTYNQFVNEKHNWSNKFNKSSHDNNFVGAFGHTFNKIEEVATKKEAEAILKERGISHTDIIESYDGMAHYRAKPKWTDYQVGKEPKTGETYTSSMTVAAYNPKSKKLYTEPTDMMKDYNKDPHLAETVGSVNEPVFDHDPAAYPEIAVEKKDPSLDKHARGVAKLLKELFSTAVSCEYDGNRIKETLHPKYKGSKVKMNITEDGKFMFDSFGKYPDVVINLKNMKEGNHNDESIKEEIKKHLKKIVERMAGVPSMSQISTFQQ